MTHRYIIQENHFDDDFCQNDSTFCVSAILSISPRTNEQHSIHGRTYEKGMCKFLLLFFL